jgi:hypothetical protein
MVAATMSAQAQLPSDWEPELEALADGQARGPQDPFVISLPAPYDQSEGRLALELDNIDVTKRVRPVDETYTRFRFVPYSPLSRGEHVLRMVEYRADGEIVERGRWVFEIRRVDAGAAYGASLTVSHRLDEDDVAEDVDETQMQGALSAEAHHDDGTRRYEGGIELVVDSTADERDPDAREVELANFLAARESSATRIAAGHETVGRAQGFDRGNLIFDGSSRRGVSGTVKPGTWNTAVTGFAQRTEPISGFEQGLGVSDEDNRIGGGFVRVQPWTNTAVGAGFISGEGGLTGPGTVGDETQLDGSAANFVLNHQWLDGALTGRAEFASTELDLGAGFEELADEALAAELRYRDRGREASGWEFGAAFVEIGPEFRSIANLGGSADIEEFRLSARRAPPGGSVSFGVEASRGEDNVDDLDIATTRKDNVSGDLRWEPRVTRDFGGALFGRPVLSLLAYEETTETVDLPAGSLTQEIDQTLHGLGVAVGFDHALGGRWSVTWQRREFEDEEDVFADERSDYVELTTRLSLLNGDLILTPTLAHDEFENRDADVSRRDTEWRLGHGWQLTERLSWDLDWNVNHLRNSDDTIDSWTRTVDTRVTWEQQAMSWWAKASWTSQDDNVGDTVMDSYQVFLGLTVDISGKVQ